MASAHASAPAEAPSGALAAPTQLPTAGAGWLASLRPDGVLELISPSGGHTSVTRVPAGHRVVDVSPDGRRFAFIDSAHDSRGAVYNATTGRWTAYPTQTLDIRFSRPTGQAVLQTRYLSGTKRVERRDLVGRLQLVLTASTPTATGVVPTTDGSRYIADEATGFTIRDNATGQVLKRVANPGGQRCTSQRWFTPDRLVRACSDGTAGKQDLHLYTMSSGANVRFTDSPAGSLGYNAAWWTSAGVFLRATPSCGASPFGLRTSSGRLSPMNTSAALHTIVGNQLKLWWDVCDGHSKVVGNYDLGTRSLRILGSSTSFAVIDPLR